MYNNGRTSRGDSESTVHSITHALPSTKDLIPTCHIKTIFWGVL